MSWAADGQDGNGLHLEKIGRTFPSLLLLVYFLFENSLDIFFLVFYEHYVQDKDT